MLMSKYAVKQFWNRSTFLPPLFRNQDFHPELHSVKTFVKT